MAKKKKDPARCLKREIDDIRYWWDHNAEEIRERTDRRILKFISANDFDSVKLISGDLSSFALYCGSHGLVSVLDGEGAGWTDIDRAVWYQYWSLKFSIGARLKALRNDIFARKLFGEVADVVSVLCFSYVHGLSELWQEFWEAWQTVLATPGMLAEGSWNGINSEGFYEMSLTRMFINSPLGQGTKLPEQHAQRPLGPYQAVLDTWEDPKAFEEPLREICDYHCRGISGSPRTDPTPPFTSTPFSLVPYEILAIYKLRAEQGLKTPEIKHPLMDLPTASLQPRKATKIEDSLFPKLQKLYEEQCLS